jgi:hypothetical protein
MLTRKEIDDLDELRRILLDLAEDLQDFQTVWARVEESFSILETIPSKTEFKDGTLELYSLYLMATQLLKGLGWSEQEIGRKLKILEKGGHRAIPLRPGATRSGNGL